MLIFEALHINETSKEGPNACNINILRQAPQCSHLRTKQRSKANELWEPEATTIRGPWTTVAPMGYLWWSHFQRSVVFFMAFHISANLIVTYLMHFTAIRAHLLLL